MNRSALVGRIKLKHHNFFLLSSNQPTKHQLHSYYLSIRNKKNRHRRLTNLIANELVLLVFHSIEANSKQHQQFESQIAPLLQPNNIFQQQLQIEFKFCLVFNLTVSQSYKTLLAAIVICCC